MASLRNARLAAAVTAIAVALSSVGPADAAMPVRKGVSLASARSPAPEPAAWAMMLLGVGATGLALRRRRRVRPA